MMDDRDADALENIIDEMARAERESYEKGLGSHILGMVEGANERREAENRALLAAITRAREAE